MRSPDTAKLRLRGYLCTAPSLISHPPAQSDRMPHYGARDRNALLSTLRHVHVLRDTILCSNTLLALSRGRIYGIAPVPDLVEDDLDYYGWLKRGKRTAFAITAPANAEPARAHSRGLRAHLPFGFRTAMAPSPRHAVLPCARNPPSRRDGERPDSRMPSQLRPERSSIMRSFLDQCGPDEFAAKAVELMQEDENRACSRVLNDLVLCDEEHDAREGHSLETLRRFVQGMNRRRRPSPGLDTVFTSREEVAALARSASPAPPQEAAGVLDFGGMRVLAHDHIHEDLMLVTSHARGPLFVDGPVTLTCYRDRIVIGRYSDTVPPVTWHPGEGPYGFKVEVLRS